MKTLKILTLLGLLIFVYSLEAQVAINTDGSAPNNKAILDVKSNNKGVLIPRVDLDTSSINTGIGFDQTGMLVFNLNSSYGSGIGFYYWTGAKWLSLASTTSAMDFDGNTYSTVKIGDKIWMAENLNSSHYSDGSSINGATSYNQNDSILAIYGRLYTWNAVMNGASSSNSNPSGVQGICPNGWHVPSNAEYIELINLIGGLSSGGGPMKEFGTYHWLTPNTDASNLSQFSALPGGMAIFSGGVFSFLYLSEYGNFWTSTEENTNNAYDISVYYNYTGIYHVSNSKGLYFSVRCIKD